jgi:hypothetical protein
MIDIAIVPRMLKIIYYEQARKEYVMLLQCPRRDIDPNPDNPDNPDTTPACPAHFVENCECFL